MAIRVTKTSRTHRTTKTRPTSSARRVATRRSPGAKTRRATRRV